MRGIAALVAQLVWKLVSLTNRTINVAAWNGGTPAALDGSGYVKTNVQVNSDKTGYTVSTNSDKTGYTVSTVSDKTGYTLTADSYVIQKSMSRSTLSTGASAASNTAAISVTLAKARLVMAGNDGADTDGANGSRGNFLRLTMTATVLTVTRATSPTQACVASYEVTEFP